MGFFDIFSKLKGKSAKTRATAAAHRQAREQAAPKAPKAPVADYKVYIQDAGGSMVSKNILSGRGKLVYCYREQPKNPYDNGWIFYSSIDDNNYQENPENMTICDFNAVAAIERSVLNIYYMSPGTSLMLVREGGTAYFLNLDTKERYGADAV